MLQFKTSEQCSVELIAHTVLADAVDTDLNDGMDHFPAQAARVSYANDTRTHSKEQDGKLIHYLADHEHLTPFEYQHATLMIECPLFIRSQIHRHRTFSYNEISRRYTSEEIGFWTPTTWRAQAEKNKQASEGVVDRSDQLIFNYQADCYSSAQKYQWMLEAGVCREQARAILPQSLLTRFYMGGNLRNWAHFLKLREDSHAQPEVQIVANKAHTILHDLWPVSLAALML